MYMYVGCFEQLQHQQEPKNSHDIFAVAMPKSGIVIGHIQKKSPFVHCFCDMEEQFTAGSLVSSVTLLIWSKEDSSKSHVGGHGWVICS